MVGNAKKKKKMQFGIFVFIEAQEINLQGNLQGSKCDGDCILLWKLFLFYKSVPFPLDPVRFFQNILAPTPGDILNWSSLVNNTQLY